MAVKSRVTLKVKRCNICGDTKSATNEFFPFRKDDVLRGECKECNAEYHVNWSKNNIERSREIKAKYAKANPEKHRGNIENDNRRSKGWREKNPEASKLNIRKAHLLKAYGLSLEDYDNMLEEQDNSCSICKTKDTGKRKHFCIDHNHETGKVRALLCGNCNLIVGMIERGPEIIESAKIYVHNHVECDYII